MKTAAFIPVKLNNDRFPGKNLKAFDGGKPLLTCILDTALQVKSIDEVYVYCSSESVAEYLPAGVALLKRPQSLDLSATSITEVFSLFTKTVEADIYTLLHATSPFVSAESIESGVQAVLSGAHDSALAVKRHNGFLWRGGRPVNYDVCHIPRTQDMEPFYTETSGFYIFTKELAAQRRRVGNQPFLVEVTDIEAMDIDEAIDFEIANAVFKHIFLKGEQHP